MPYCGVNSGIEAAKLAGGAGNRAVAGAGAAVRPGALHGPGKAFGMLVLGSPDPQRYHAGMGTEFLEHVGELAAAALSRLRPR